MLHKIIIQNNQKFALAAFLLIILTFGSAQAADYPIVAASDNVSEAAANDAPANTEEILMREIMKQIHQDYHTDNIVIGIDSFQNVNSADGAETFAGQGEVRIGDLTWRKIKFQLTLNEQQQAENIDYQIK